MKRMNYYLAALLLLGLSMSSCKKEETTSDPIITTSEDNSEVSALFDDIDNETNDVNAFKSEMVDTVPSTGTRTITIDTTGGQKVITIAFTNYVNGKNTRVKNGKIIVTIAGAYMDQAEPFEKVVTFQDFYVDDNKIEGTRTVTKNANNPLEFNITMENAKITFSDGTSYTRTLENRTRTWSAGSTTATVWDDEYDITGSASGVNRKGENYTHTITTALHVATICPYIESGVISIVVGEKTATIDYGTGGCDRLATVTYNGKTHNILLRGGR